MEELVTLLLRAFADLTLKPKEQEVLSQELTKYADKGIIPFLKAKLFLA